MIYSISVSSGLESLARKEILARYGHSDNLKILKREPQKIVFQFNGNPKDLLELRTAEHLHIIAKHITGMTRSRQSLTAIRNAISRLNLQDIVNRCRQTGMRLRKRIPFRVICRMSGQRNFQKRDLQQVVEKVFINRGWQLTRSESGMDILVELHGGDAYISIRISKQFWGERIKKQTRIAHSIKSTIAYGMVSLSQPHPNDVFLDPMCGAGTILLERAYSGRYRYLIGGDISTESLDATKMNFGRQHQPRQFFQWEAQKLPIQQNAVDRIVCNMTINTGTREAVSEISNFYRNALHQLENVLKPKGRMVLLTLDPLQLDKRIRQHNNLRVRQKVSVDVSGKRGRIFVIYHI